jgi:uncharacterized protein YoxC
MVNFTGWYVGYIVAAALIVVVVVLVGWLLSLARGVGMRANAIAEVISEIRGTTAPVPLVGSLNEKLARVVEQATTARTALLGEDAT